MASGMAGGTFPLDCFGLGIEVRPWVEMVMPLNLSGVGARVPKCTKTNMK